MKNTKKLTNLPILCAGLTLISATSQAAVIFTVDESARAGQPDTEAFDADLPVQISNTDLLAGLTPTVTTGGVFGDDTITDGIGPNRGFVTGGQDGARFLTDGASTITWTGLGGIDLGELRLFGYGIDARSLMEFEVLLDTGSGFNSLLTVDNGSSGPVGVIDGTNLVRVYDNSGILLGSGVNGIQIIYQDNFGGPNGAALGEIDAFATSPVPEPSSTALIGLGGLALILRRRKL